MGKIRIKTIGEEEPKKEKKQPKTKAHLPGMEGGQRIAVVGPTEEELTKIDLPAEALAEEGKQKVEKKTKKKPGKSHRSKKYKEMLMEVDRTKTYSLADALALLPKVKLSKFDETVELHINTIQTGISGQMKLPHGTGKATKVAIADDDLISEIEKGKISFDILVATPAMMPKLAKVAKILGPRGLMPNPKAGTITEKPEEVVKKYEGGVNNYRTELKAPIIHLTVGKLSFGSDKLSENINTAISTIKKENIKTAVLKSTMSPGIKLQV